MFYFKLLSFVCCQPEMNEKNLSASLQKKGHSTGCTSRCMAFVNILYSFAQTAGRTVFDGKEIKQKQKTKHAIQRQVRLTECGCKNCEELKTSFVNHIIFSYFLSFCRVKQQTPNSNEYKINKTFISFDSFSRTFYKLKTNTAFVTGTNLNCFKCVVVGRSHKLKLSEITIG